MDVAQGLARLGVKRMLLAIHDVSFPSDPDEDIGRGSPATRAAARCFGFARDLGFTGIQLGPQGQASRTNPSPYDGTAFSRHLGNIALASLRAGGPYEGLVDGSLLDRVLVAGGGPAQHQHAYDAMHTIVEAAYGALERGARPDLRARLDVFRRDYAAWLVPDALHAALSIAYRGAGYREWEPRDRDAWLNDDRHRIAELVTEHQRAVDRYAFGQMLVAEEHARVRATCGLKLYGDLQVGYADSDAWAFAACFMQDYVMGAPPSRTNPEGQPWGVAVLDPGQYAGAVLALVTTRAHKAFTEYDSLRIDHPHGLVCPWVYRRDREPAAAVKHGTRLFESPDAGELADHAALARFAIAKRDQIDSSAARYADGWVRDLEPAQIDRYAILIDAIVAAAESHGRSRSDLSFEVLSTMPTPLARVIRRFGLGRWRVTQKANLDDANDVYRTEHAAPADWLMLGNHDTPPIAAVIAGWTPAKREQWARHLSARLSLPHPERLAAPGYFATAMLAELFLSPAENVSIFFADLFGFEQRFNEPGVVGDHNWTLRLPPTFAEDYAARVSAGEAVDIAAAVQLALAATP